MSKKYDAIIVGARSIGASIAFEMSKRGHKTLVVDKLGFTRYYPVPQYSGSRDVIRGG